MRHVNRTDRSASRPLTVAIVAAAAATSCRRRPAASDEPRAYAVPIPIADGGEPGARRPPATHAIVGTTLLAPRGDLSIGLVYPTRPATEPDAALRALAERPAYAFTVSAPGPGPRSGRTVAIESHLDAPEAITTEQELSYFGRGLSPADRTALLAAHSATLLGFEYDTTHTIDEMLRVERFALEAAENAHAYLYDLDTREYFTVEAWRAMRIGSLTQQPIDLDHQITMHQYAEGGAFRAVSLGMRRFGLPDLAVADAPGDIAQSFGPVMHRVLSSAIENPAIASDGRFTVRIGPAPNAGTVDVRLVAVEPDQGDADNRLMTIDFGANRSAAQHALVRRFVTEPADNAVGVRPDDQELREASNRARAQLPRIRERFQRGLAAGDQLMLKAPFRSSDGRSEYMWVRVLDWTPETIRGTLMNEPNFVPGLHLGARVTFQQDSVFDYLLTHADGTRESGGTSEIIERMQH